MSTLIVVPGKTPNKVFTFEPKGWDYFIVGSEDFNSLWAQRNTCGMQYRSIQIWESFDSEATAYVLSRLRWEGRASALMTKAVWEGLLSTAHNKEQRDDLIMFKKDYITIAGEIRVSN